MARNGGGLINTCISTVELTKVCFCRNCSSLMLVNEDDHGNLIFPLPSRVLAERARLTRSNMPLSEGLLFIPPTFVLILLSLARRLKNRKRNMEKLVIKAERLKIQAEADAIRAEMKLQQEQQKQQASLSSTSTPSASTSSSSASSKQSELAAKLDYMSGPRNFTDRSEPPSHRVLRFLYFNGPMNRHELWSRALHLGVVFYSFVHLQIGMQWNTKGTFAHICT